MSDFIYSKVQQTEGLLAKQIQAIYHEDAPLIHEFHGQWGSLAVSQNLYYGFQPYETKEHLCILIGGPVLSFREQEQIFDATHDVEGTLACYERWLNNEMKFDEDLSGPYTMLIVNKSTSEVTCVTDLMSFIPVYALQEKDNLMLATHTDMLARAANREKDLDLVSEVDFILYGAVTYPYTIYEDILQVQPASIHTVDGNTGEFRSDAYWVPIEERKYNSINAAAADLRAGLESYVHSVTAKSNNMAQFLSGGEDSRTLSALLAHIKNRNAFIFLEEMNREGEIAEKAASAYNAKFQLITRDKMHYLEMLPSCSNLVGAGSQYFHVHTFGLHKRCQLGRYLGVFGGLLADALLKGSHIRKLKGTHLVPFFPQIKRGNFTMAHHVMNNAFGEDVLKQVQQRRATHLEYIKTFRSESADEWFELWPSSMNVNIPNIHGNRRLFRSYEPFMAKEIVKISAVIPQSWKLNRRVFHKAVKPLLKPTKWLLHGEGKLPYFPWYVNVFVQFFLWSIREVGKITKLSRKYQGPWFEWGAILGSQEWKDAVYKYADGQDRLNSCLKSSDVEHLFTSNDLNYVQKINLLQMMYVNHSIESKDCPKG